MGVLACDRPSVELDDIRFTYLDTLKDHVHLLIESIRKNQIMKNETVLSILIGLAGSP